MLAVALNYLGMQEDKSIAPMFVELFNEFKVIKLNPCDDIPKESLQLCEPQEYEELIKHIRKEWDKTSTYLELHGVRTKLQRAVRQMFFFDEEKKFENFLLEGCDGISDFPWALQILVVQMPITISKQNREQIKKADLIILDNSPAEVCQEFVVKVKKISPNTPVFTEVIQTVWSQELISTLEELFASYLENRLIIKKSLTKKYPQKSISCEQASRMARNMKVNRYLFGSVCDECGYSITHCGLGCF